MNQSNGAMYFISGANGFIGSQLCKLLLERGHGVRGMVRRNAPNLERAGVELVRGDLAVVADWAKGLRDLDIVIHCAGNPRFGNGVEFEAENVLTTANLLEAIRANAPQIKRFVFVSTVGVMDRAASDCCSRALDETTPHFPSSDYGRSKLAAEQLVASSGLPFVIVRPALVVGVGMRADSHFAVFARWVLQNHLLARIAWKGCFSVVDVEDLSEALLLCATHPEAVNRTLVCGGQPIRLDEFFEMVKPALRFPLGIYEPIIRMTAFAMPFKLKSMLLPALVVDDRALRQLGWRPRHRLQESLRLVIERERARFDPTTNPPEGQTVITGAASGLGRALVEYLRPFRTRILLVDRDPVGLVELLRKFPTCRMKVADLADESAWEALLESSEWTMHPVSELYACAGFGRRGEFAADQIEVQLDMMRVNVMARMRLIHAVVADMSRIHFGRIVLVSSSSAFQPLPLMTAYAASNAAVLSFGEGLAHGLRGRSIHVMTVCPGGMKTKFQKHAGVKEIANEKLMLPEKAAALIMGGLARHDTTLVLSGRAKAMALLARVLPRGMLLSIWGRLMAALR